MGQCPCAYNSVALKPDTICNCTQELGGPQIPATGFAIGFDRLAEISALKSGDYCRKPDVFVAALGAKSQSLAFEWICQLGLIGIGAEMDFSDKSLKSQMKRADRLGASYVLILGDKELAEGAAILRNMVTKEQVSISLENILDDIKSQIKTTHPLRRIGAAPQTFGIDSGNQLLNGLRFDKIDIQTELFLNGQQSLQ